MGWQRVVWTVGLLAAACEVDRGAPAEPWPELETGEEPPASVPNVAPQGSSSSGTGFGADASTATGERAASCETVDLLFVIDNSGSMADEQLNLVANVPAFVDGVEQTLGARTDYHVGVISTDASRFNAPGCQQLGALVTKTGGELSSDRHCGPYAAGAAYMTPEDDLATTFACAARLGVDGDGIERPMDALAAALAPQGALAGCNAGFLRDDALLVVVLMTDEEDFGDSAGSPEQWFGNVVAAKGGDPERVVVLSLVGHPKPNSCIAEQWTGMEGAELATRIIRFTGLFPHGYVGDICAADYQPFFEAAVEHVNTACADHLG